MARRMGRSWSKATKRSPSRSAGLTRRRRASRWLGWVTTTMGSSRRGSTCRARLAARIGQDAEVRLVVEHRLDHLVGVQALEEHPRVRIGGHERLHVAAHVVQADRVDRGHPHRALHPLPGGGEVGAGLLEARRGARGKPRRSRGPRRWARAAAASGRGAGRRSSPSSCWMAWLAADWETPPAAAAREKLRSRTTSQKSRRVSRVTGPL